MSAVAESFQYGIQQVVKQGFSRGFTGMFVSCAQNRFVWSVLVYNRQTTSLFLRPVVYLYDDAEVHAQGQSFVLKKAFFYIKDPVKWNPTSTAVAIARLHGAPALCRPLG